VYLRTLWSGSSFRFAYLIIRRCCHASHDVQYLVSVEVRENSCAWHLRRLRHAFLREIDYLFATYYFLVLLRRAWGGFSDAGRACPTFTPLSAFYIGLNWNWAQFLQINKQISIEVPEIEVFKIADEATYNLKLGGARALPSMTQHLCGVAVEGKDPVASFFVGPIDTN